MTLEGLTCGAPLEGAALATVRSRAVLDCMKWNVEDEGRSNLSEFPLLLGRALYARLAAWAVALDLEARRAEAELLGRPALHRALGIHGVTPHDAYRAIVREAREHPTQWVAQRDFGAAPIATPEGPRFPAIGVYVVDGRAAGLYARLAERPLIDTAARDAVVLLRRER
jgi:hypothetical protein